MREEFRFVPLEQIIKSPEKYWAHVPKEGSEIRKQETLPEHTIRCEKYFQQIGKEKCLPLIMEKFRDYYLEGAGEDAVGLFEELWQNVPVFHDAGKINCYYQRDVLKNMETEFCFHDFRYPAGFQAEGSFGKCRGQRALGLVT